MKLRDDNQNMFNDLKGLASNEENNHFELQGMRQKKMEQDKITESLQEKC